MGIVEENPSGGFEFAAAEDVEQLRELAARLAERNLQLEQALESRILIEQAKGVLAERFQLSTEEAFAALRRAARSNRMRIHELARTVIVTRETPPEIRQVLRS